jgi:carboxyl-terminal processing protease
MKNRPVLIILGIVVIFMIIAATCAAGFAAVSLFRTSSVKTLFQSALPTLAVEIMPSPQESVESTTVEGTPLTSANSNEEIVVEPTQSTDELFTAFWQAWDLVHQQYVDQPVNDEQLMRGAIQGMLQSLGDQHTSYLDPEEYKAANAVLQGEEYEGIGAWVDITGEYLQIISPMPGSPAEKAGLKPGDQIISIDGEDMTGIDGEAVRQKVLGPHGTDVTLTIRREGVEEPIDIVVTRGKIVVPSVDAKMLDNGLAYVRLLTFGEDTVRDLRKALDELMAQNPKGLILDLRNNGGGYLDTAIGVTSQFISDGVIMYEQYGDGTKDEFKARSGGLATDIPMVVLINEGTASASEIVAGAVQDRGRGELVGMTSFGKGSVQSYSSLVDDQGAVRITIARWLTPSGRTIHQVGLTPDEEVKLTDEDIQQDRDPQLDKAIEILLAK